MTRNEMYDIVETNASREALAHLLENLEEPVILIGGWAVYLLVNNSYEKEHSVSYLGSRDVDLGFHIQKDASSKDLLEGHFKRSLRIIKDIGYFEIGTSRYVRIIEKNSGKILTEKEAASFPQYDLFYMYVDPIIDNPNDIIKDLFRIKPIDEPLLEKALSESRMVELEYHGKGLFVPEPEIILSMKLSSFPNRTKDDKRIKDACDIYSLIWHSGRPYSEIIRTVRFESKELIEKARPHFTDDIIRAASYHLGVDEATFIGVIQHLWE